MAENICIHCGLKTTFLNAKFMSAGPVHFACMAAYDLSGEQESGDNPEDQKRDRKHRHSDQPGTEKAVPSSDTVLSSDYGAARAVSGIGEFLGWVLVLLAVVLVFISASQDMGAVGYVVALGVGISGLFLVMMAQFVRATVSNADTTREILRLLQTKSQ